MSARLLRPLTRRLPSTSPKCLQTVRPGSYRIVQSNPPSGNINTLRITRPYSSKPSSGEGMGPNPEDQKSKGSSPPPKPRRFLKLSLATLISGYALHSLLLKPNDLSLSDIPIILGLTSPRSLNTTSFVPYTIVSREQVSSTAFIITVEPFNPRHTVLGQTTTTTSENLRNQLQEAWHHGLWCVEIKQPQLQVARDYTPLPPPVGQEKEEMVRGRLRFLIRKMEGGEVSSYLSRLEVGDKVELRGPHLGFDVVQRLGLESTAGKKQGQVVFLAGGTGIAPALQVARRLYGPVYEKGDDQKEWKQVENMPTTPPKMTIVWANRFREDCPDCEELEGLRKRGYLSSSIDVKKEGGMMPYLQDIKLHHPQQFNYACTVDTEKKWIDGKTIVDAVVSTTTSNNKSLVKGTATADPSCPLHSSAALVHVSDRQDHEAQCKCHGGSSNGKNLLMVSGPDGFIERFAGPKAWSQGLERQGPVGGVVDELMRKGKVKREEWMVLKL
ncbi:hypothetical protein B0T20DRAFT_401117 [Sordaria brevicollis]|uniref:FAD-binding FR-type domain-containing protein n=1 Tax=Sordaria brevicollis TaxID=83679 RepID=A0AAE0PP78_SORBR|nr:hypothetical protein B0T20DRAFT_401117 [Sordaria brevicollis]